MLSNRGDIRPDPTIMLMDDLLDQVQRGQVRVPEFQRPFVWRPEQMLDLFDSIERGYPIGSLLLWQTDEQIPALDRIGGISLPYGSDGQVSYVLDGHQRISTLFGVLRRQGDLFRPKDPRDAKWWVYRDLRAAEPERNPYRHNTAASGATPEHFLPLRAVGNTIDFLHFSRDLELRMGGRRSWLEEMLREAEAVAQRIKGYKLTVIWLRGARLEQAVEVYTRLNRMGMRMDADQMVSALTHRKGRPTLASRIDDIVSGIAATGFGEIPRMAVFRLVLAVAGEPDVMSPRWEAVAHSLQDKLQRAVPQAEEAIDSAVYFLRRSVGLPLARLLPYAHQLTLLAWFFRWCPHPSDEQVRTLRQWFWVTSWAGSFAGATSTTLRRALREMADFATGESGLSLDLAGVQPMPDEFNFNSARTRAFAIWELHALPERLDALGQRFDVVQHVASGGTQVFRPVVTGDKRPANRLILPTSPNMTVSTALRELPESLAREVLDSHGIPLRAWHRLREGGKGGTLFVDDRTELLAGRLRAFARDLDIPLNDGLVGIADEDTE